MYYTVSQKKLCQLIFCSLSVKCERISIKIETACATQYEFSVVNGQSTTSAFHKEV